MRDSTRKTAAKFHVLSNVLNATCVLDDPITAAIAAGVMVAVAGLFISLCGACNWARCTLLGVGLFVVVLIILLIYGAAGCWILVGSLTLGYLIAALGILLS